MQGIEINVYRDPRGVHFFNEWWKYHDKVKLTNIESVCPDFHVYDFETNPVPVITYANDAGVDGSRLEYLSFQKSIMTITGGFTYHDTTDYWDKKGAIDSYFVTKACLVIQTNIHPGRRAIGYVSKPEIKSVSSHYASVVLTLDNPLGMWFTTKTSSLEDNWTPNLNYDLNVPTSFHHAPSWKISSGRHQIWIGGDEIMKFTTPMNDTTITLNNVNGEFGIVDHTTGKSLIAHNQDGDLNGETVCWNGLDLRDQNGEQANGMVDSTDFWLYPGFNDIEVVGADSAYLDTRFYFKTP